MPTITPHTIWSAVSYWRCRGIGQDDEREEQHRLKIGSSEHFGTRPDRSRKRGREQQIVDAEKREHQRHLVDAVGDEDAADKQRDLRVVAYIGKRAPPALPGVKHIERGDDRERGRIEYVGRSVRTTYLLMMASDRRDRDDVPRLLRAEHHRDDQPVSTAPLGKSHARGACGEWRRRAPRRRQPRRGVRGRRCGRPRAAPQSPTRIASTIVNRPFGVLKNCRRRSSHRGRPDVSTRSSAGVRMSPSTPCRSRSLRPSAGPSTNAAVASASASIALGATTVTLATPRGDAPVRGSRMWCSDPPSGHRRPLVVPRRAHSLVRDAHRIDQLTVDSGMTDADRPGLPRGLRPPR